MRSEDLLTWEVKCEGGLGVVAFSDIGQAWRYYLGAVRGAYTGPEVLLTLRYGLTRHIVVESLGNLNHPLRLHYPNKTSELQHPSLMTIRPFFKAWVQHVTKQDEAQKGNEEVTDKTKLYEIQLPVQGGSLTAYGHVLAINSAGKLVVEIKGSGEVIAVDPKQVQEVLPYTVGVKFTTSSGATTYHYLDEKRQLKPGDFLVMESALSQGLCIAMCTAVDTKSKTATKEINPLKILS